MPTRRFFGIRKADPDQGCASAAEATQGRQITAYSRALDASFHAVAGIVGQPPTGDLIEVEAAEHGAQLAEAGAVSGLRTRLQGIAAYLCGRNFRAVVFGRNVDYDGADGGAGRAWHSVVGTSEPVLSMTIRHRLWIASAWADQPDQRCVSPVSPYYGLLVGLGGDHPGHPSAGTVTLVSPDRVARPLTIHPVALSLC
jgi:hypothetical protein